MLNVDGCIGALFLDLLSSGALLCCLMRCWPGVLLLHLLLLLLPAS